MGERRQVNALAEIPTFLLKAVLRFFYVPKVTFQQRDTAALLLLPAVRYPTAIPNCRDLTSEAPNHRLSGGKS